jgi:hypothetical protein
LESLSQLRKQAKQRLLAQARTHADYRILIKLPGFGPVRVAQPQLKQVFKGAALAALRHQAIKAYYERLISTGARPELARVSVARKLASIALTVWQRREEFDVKKAFAQN